MRGGQIRTASEGSEQRVLKQLRRSGSVFRLHLQAKEGEVFERRVTELWHGGRGSGLANLNKHKNKQ